MNRRILPIGQGNFAIEKFSDFTAVFDCGSKTDVDLVKNEIDMNFFDKEKINVVFVSHLDDDHLNGLDYLIDKCIIERIVIPYLYEEMVITSYLYNKMLNRNITSSFLNFIYNRFLEEDYNLDSYKEVKIIQIPSYNSDNFKQNPEDATREYSSLVMKLMSSLNKKNPEWLFLPFNYDFLTRSVQFHKAISSDPDLSGLSIYSLVKNWRDYVEKLKKIFKSTKITGGINDNSMVIYSGPMIRRYNELYFVNDGFFHRIGCSCYKNEIGAIYMGDYSAHKVSYYNEFLKYYNSYINYVGLVIIPHHGSKNGYNANLPLDFDGVFLISHGLTYAHSCNHLVLKDILAKGRRIILVNEKSPVFEQIIL